MSAQDRLIQVQKNIQNACERSGRQPSEVELVGVSKKKSAEEIRAFFELGLKSFGENYLQEALPKLKEIPKSAMRLHFIGHLQSNKVKPVVENFDVIHSVDRLKILKVIDRHAEEMKKIQEVLLQLNIGDEDSKSGFSAEEVIEQISELFSYKNVVIRGLMSFPPLGDEKQTREYFRKTKMIFDRIRGALTDEQAKQFDSISMGTTSDYGIAIEEGATMVRVGTALFGERS